MRPTGSLSVEPECNHQPVASDMPCVSLLVCLDRRETLYEADREPLPSSFLHATTDT